MLKYVSIRSKLAHCRSQANIKVAKREPIMLLVLEHLQNGWTSDADDSLLCCYNTRRIELEIHRGC